MQGNCIIQVLRKIEGATPSERREFRALERHRHEVLNEEKKEKGAAAASKLSDVTKDSIASRTTCTLFKQRSGP